MELRNRSGGKAARVLLAAGSLMAFAGCATMGGAPAGENAAESAAIVQHAVRVQVENQNWAMVNVYAARPGRAVRLGSVSTGSTETFELPQGMDLPGSRIEIRPLASASGYVSPQLEYGRDVKITVANHLPLSTTVPMGVAE